MFDVVPTLVSRYYMVTAVGLHDVASPVVYTPFRETVDIKLMCVYMYSCLSNKTSVDVGFIYR